MKKECSHYDFGLRRMAFSITGYWIRCWIYQLCYVQEPLVSSLPPLLLASTHGRVLAAVYIWNIKEWVCISLSCLLTGHGGAEQKQHVSSTLLGKYFPKIFSKSHLRIFAITRRLKNAHRQASRCAACVVEQRSWPVFYWSSSKSSHGGRSAALISSCISSRHLLELFVAKLHEGTWRKTTTRPERRTPHGQWSASATRQKM